VSINRDCFSVVRSFTVLYIIAPCFLFALGWLRQPYAFINVVLLSCFTIQAIKEMLPLDGIVKSIYLLDKKRLYVYVGLVFLFAFWLLFSGTGGFGFQNTDYRASNSLLKDLILQNWPLNLQLKGITGRYVYYMAYYLPAAYLGKIFGWSFANCFLLLWTLIGVVFAFLWFVRISRIYINDKYQKLLAISVLFCLLGGLDLFGTVYLRNHIFKISTENEWWAGYFQYSSNTTLVYWVPQQAIAAWLITGLVVDALFDFENIKFVGVVISCGFIWTPFGVTGLVPFICIAIISFAYSKGFKYIDKNFIWLSILSLWVGFIHILYIGANQLKFPIGFAWSDVEDLGRFIKYIIAFWFLEFGLLAILLLLLLSLGIFGLKSIRKKNLPLLDRINIWKYKLNSGFQMDYRQFLLLVNCILILLFLPLIKVGVYNDVVMRGSVPALFVFWSVALKVVFDSSAWIRVRYNLIYSMILVILIIGFYPAVNSILVSFKRYHFGAPEYSLVLDSSDANSLDIVIQRMGNAQSFFYRYIGK
jgi:hypothetical protein